MAFGASHKPMVCAHWTVPYLFCELFFAKFTGVNFSFVVIHRESSPWIKKHRIQQPRANHALTGAKNPTVCGACDSFWFMIWFWLIFTITPNSQKVRANLLFFLFQTFRARLSVFGPTLLIVDHAAIIATLRPRCRLRKHFAAVRTYRICSPFHEPARIRMVKFH